AGAVAAVAGRRTLSIKAGGRGRWVVQVAERQVGTAHADLRQLTDAGLAAVGVQEQQLSTLDSGPDRHRVSGLAIAGAADLEPGHRLRRLGGAVEVDQAG